MLLLTGATGLAGSFIANEFVRQHEPVRILVRDRARASDFEKFPTIELVEGDMSKPDTLGHVLDGVERVMMISGPTMDMVETQSAFIDTSKAAGVRHVIKFSGLDARPETTFPFGRMHWDIEQYLEGSGLAWTHLRPSGFMQEYLREAPSILYENAIYLPLGEVPLNPVDVADVGEVGFQLLRHGGHEGEALPMTGPEALTMGEIASRISSAAGRTIRYVPISPADRRRALLQQGIPSELVDALDRQVEERLKLGAESRVDLSTNDLFNVRPTTFLEFAQRHARAFGAVSAAA